MSRPVRVLIIEDSPDDAELICLALDRGGLSPLFKRVETAEALADALASEPWDVILSDYTLPGFDALAALALLQRAALDVPFLVVSGTVGEERAVDAMRRGAQDYVLKSNLTRLAPAVERELREAANRRARREAERVAEAQHRVLAESIPQLVWIARPDGAVEYFNRRWLEYAGVPLGELVRGERHEVFHPDDLPRMRAAWTRALQTGEFYDTEYRLRRADGEYRWHIGRAVPFKDDVGQVVRWFGTCTDIHDQRQAMEAAARGALLLANVRDSIVVTDLEGTVTYWNEGATRLFGWTAEEMLGQPLEKRIPLAERENSRAAFRAIAAGHAFDGEWLDSRKDGSRVWVEAHVSRIHDQSGQPIGVLGLALDISDRKAAEAERDRLFRRLRLQIERLPLAYVLIDADFRITDWNSAAERVFGYRKDEILGESVPFPRLLPIDARAQAEALLDRIRKGDMAAHAVNTNLTRDGRTILCEWYNTPIFEDDGTFLGMFSLAQDVTERRRAEEARDRLAAIVESSEDAILSEDLDGTITSWNRSAERLYGYTAEEVVGRPAALLSPPERCHESSAVLGRIRRGEDVEHFETLRLHRDGSAIEVALTVSPIRDAAGRIVGASKITRDLRAQRQAEAALRRTEEQLRQAQKMESLGRLAGGIAHDFNNILTAIMGFSQLLCLRLNNHEVAHRDALEIERAAARAAALTRQLLAFSRQQVLDPRVLDLGAVVAGLEPMLRRLIGADVKVVVEGAPRLGRVLADAGQVEQILMNLAVNARDAMADGGTLTIGTYDAELDAASLGGEANLTPGPFVVLEVRDTGCGMDAATRERVFEPFFTTKELGKGTGLGLSTVYGIVTQSGGHVSVESEPGRGTRFRIYLPRVDEALPSQAPNAARDAPLGGTETVLLVEDEEQVRAVLAAALRQNGYTVLDAANGREGLERIADTGRPLDLLVTDVTMPELGGLELGAHAARLRPGLGVLYISGYAEQRITRQVASTPGVHYLSKPFTPETFLQTVRTMLDRPQPGVAPKVSSAPCLES